MNEKVKYRIKGKIYYKIAEEVLKDEDTTLVDGIWQMTNPKGDQFRLLIGRGGKRFTLYLVGGKTPVLRTTSISRVS